jgi:hypothetical protein
MDETYEKGAELCAKLVGEAKTTAPAFRFPPYPLLSDLGEVGQKLATNDAARELVALLCKRSRERFGPSRLPTVLMLQVSLDRHGIPYATVSLSELGLEVPRA